MTRAAKVARAAKLERRLSRRMDQVERLAVNALARSQVQIAKRIIKKARDYVPVDTGYLRSTGFVGHAQKTSKGYKVELGFRAWYAAVVEKRQPYLAPAVREVMPQLADQIRANRQVLYTLPPIYGSV